MVSTESLPDAERAPAWERAVRHWLAPLSVSAPPSARPFEGALWSSDLGYVRVLSVRADPLRLSRTTRLVTAAPDDRVALVAQVSGTAALHQDGRSTAVRPGELALCDLRRPFSFEQREPFRLQVLCVPGHALGGSGSRAHRVTGRAVPTGEGVAALLGPFLSALVARAHRVAGPVGDRLAGNAADLLATLIDEQSPDGRLPGPAPREQLRTLIRRYIDDNLRNPDLSPARIAEAHRISVRYLHLLFEDEETTVRRLIQRRRTEACARELVRRGTATPTISAVARGWGFRNVAHFSRSFKAVYGHPPRDWRAAGTQVPAP
ncbi:helix-turn-helix domain-containing protein [Streptomyces sp. NPDC085946]|uniref:AraC-like ligand-binding domain-containing protein n=1 Tax=Streptomyces sp. NPDC085946 TaxID=3365744 RepID=UPI0037D58C8D